MTQSTTATALAEWLNNLSHTPAGQEFDGAPGGLIEKVTHSSLQKEEFVARQHASGHAPCFAVLVSISFGSHQASRFLSDNPE
jgi:cystathionine gamma-synthase